MNGEKSAQCRVITGLVRCLIFDVILRGLMTWNTGWLGAGR